MKFFNRILRSLVPVIAAASVFTGCRDEESDVVPGYGYVQFYLFKATGSGFSSDISNFDVAANIYDSSWQPHMALSYSEAAMKAAPNSSYLLISFYKDMSELGMYKPSAALVLVKM